MTSLPLCFQAAGSTRQPWGLLWASGSWPSSFPSPSSSSAASTNAKNAKSAAKRRVSSRPRYNTAELVCSHVPVSDLSSPFSLLVPQRDSKSETRISTTVVFKPHFRLRLFPHVANRYRTLLILHHKMDICASSTEPSLKAKVLRYVPRLCFPLTPVWWLWDPACCFSLSAAKSVLRSRRLRSPSVASLNERWPASVEELNGPRLSFSSTCAPPLLFAAEVLTWRDFHRLTFKSPSRCWRHTLRSSDCETFFLKLICSPCFPGAQRGLERVALNRKFYFKV